MTTCSFVREALNLQQRCCSACHAYLSEGGGGLPSSIEVNGEHHEVCCEVAHAGELMKRTPAAPETGGTKP